MRIDAVWAGFIYFLDIITFQSPKHDAVEQAPVLGDAHFEELPPGPIFTPPSADLGDKIECDYTKMIGWKACSSETDRGCWLKGPKGEYFGINTNYELFVPTGINRQYYLEVTDEEGALDGVLNTGLKLFNKQYPGPWIQACWGDTLEITVKNKLKKNGTTVHWHGLRQLDTTDMDGVNGVTQCPIAPGQSFTYKFRAMQYGSSWYHSHYSLQYGDGMLGPMTIHGPSSASYDDARAPILMTDWLHRSAFDIWSESIHYGTSFRMDNILVNGKGLPPPNTPAESIKGNPERYSLVFETGKRYLLRLINTSVDTAFIFAIDNHTMELVGADFVPIHANETDHVVVGIGKPINIRWLRGVDLISKGNVIMSSFRRKTERTIPLQTGITGSVLGRQKDAEGVVRYNSSSTSDPTTQNRNYSLKCRDQDYNTLRPILEWQVGPPGNLAKNSYFEVGLDPTSGKPFYPEDKQLNRWNMFTDTMWLDFSSPTLANINKSCSSWDKNFVVITENQKPDTWIYLLVSGTGIPRTGRFFPPAAHPIHLHGHDFAILEQSEKPYQIGVLNLKLDNPPRRDVALLPADGYLVLAFKSDNPGAWLMHCHIAWHASGGLALQILENEAQIRMSEQQKRDLKNTCDDWKLWRARAGVGFEQDDSGI
ncbi:hypothetical protein MMC26_007223 [Xylographa opegraphella]|nr:hypothetical protein [Xylographa opegraphella]